MRHAFATLDVFSRRRLTGNPLAVVFDAEELDQATMHAIAREFNLPETVFVMRPADPANHARLRIFTVSAELPFAGHPTIGAAVLLSHLRDPALPRELRLEEAVGVVHCRVSGIDRTTGRAEIRVPGLPRRSGEAAPADRIAGALGIDLATIGFERFAPTCWSTGIPFTFVPLKSRDALAQCSVVVGRWDAGFSHEGSRAAFAFCRRDDGAFAARMFAPRLGIPEDPATGSAAAAFAGVLAEAGELAAPRQRFLIEQGVEMGRPSEIELSVVNKRGTISEVSIAGEAVQMSQGSIEI
jgi:trans-2,3-dihydro-3-hydroxyanthranilate isomerase